MVVKENAKVARHLIRDRLARTDAPTVDAVAPGEGAIVSMHGERMAVYCDDAKTLHTLSPVCRHLACYVSWNRAEKELGFAPGPAHASPAKARHPRLAPLSATSPGSTASDCETSSVTE
jgi:Rieske Fe-S protein